MNITLTWQTVLTAAALAGAFAALAGYLRRLFGWFDRQQKQDRDIRDIKAEQSVAAEALLACLDGLLQLGANHSVPEAREKLSRHLNEKAHR